MSLHCRLWISGRRREERRGTHKTSAGERSVSLRWRLFILSVVVASVLVVVRGQAFAQEEPPVPDEQCLVCHSKPTLSMVLPSNEVLLLTVDANILAHSAHGLEAETPLHCVDCHNNMDGYPHGDFPAADYRSYQVQMSMVCGNCHEDQAVARQDSIHARLLAGGRIEAATCVDCHGAHEVVWADPEKHEVDRVAQVEACGQCHSTIAAEYEESVHGQHVAAGGQDAPTCSNCHPAHKIEDPRSAEFRLKSPEVCAQCHADEALMAKYEISTDVFDTYVADFHGTTVQIFESVEPGVYTNKAVCSDCHSAHHILPPTDENSSVMEANLLATCQRCHPDAGENFAASWMGHYRPSWERFPLVTAVDWFYKILIPGVLGFFVVYIGLDMGRTWYDRSKQRREYRRARRKQGKAEKGSSEGGES